MLQALFPPGSLWHERRFMGVFWAATLSVLGTAVSQMALPLTAVELLHASATEMGVLAAAQLLPFILCLPAGVWIDRSRKQKLAVGFNLFAALGLLLVPLAYWQGFLSIPLLCLVAAMISTTEAIGGSATQVFITHLVGRERLVEANSKLFGASSAAMVVGPALAAALIAAVGAPFAVTADALSFVLAALLIGTIRVREPAPEPVATSLWQQTRDGLLLVWRTPMLRALVGVVCVWITLNDSFKALYVLFASRELALGAGAIALINTLGAIGGLAGAWIAHRLERRCGIRLALATGVAVGGLGYVLYALPGAGWPVPALWAGAALLVMDTGATVYVVNYLSLRQRVTPDGMLGRMVTTMRFLTILLAPLGTILIGRAGDVLGLRPTFIGIGGLCVLTGLLAARCLPRQC